MAGVNFINILAVKKCEHFLMAKLTSSQINQKNCIIEGISAWGE